jgi:hypothetical protein
LRNWWRIFRLGESAFLFAEMQCTASGLAADQQTQGIRVAPRQIIVPDRITRILPGIFCIKQRPGRKRVAGGFLTNRRRTGFYEKTTSLQKDGQHRK